MKQPGSTVALEAPLDGPSLDPAPTAGRRRERRRFLLHVGEMLLAMFVGMAVLGGVASGIFALAGGSLSDASTTVHALVMGFNMTVPMVWWMRYRRHDWGRTTEMAAAMVVPTLGAVALDLGGLIPSDAVSGVQHGVMIPAMVAVMLWRYDHYARGH